MRTTWLLILIELAALSCSSRPAEPEVPPPPTISATPTPAPATPLEEGSSAQAAVLVEADTERAGIAWENEWIYRHYGRFRKKTVALAGEEGRRLDVITVELADHSEKVLYFDISNFFGK
jgi:hypothetical protein